MRMSKEEAGGKLNPNVGVLKTTTSQGGNEVVEHGLNYEAVICVSELAEGSSSSESFSCGVGCS